MIARVAPLLAAVASLAFSPSSVLAEDWPAFRGPLGEGHSTEKELPLEWSETKGIVWKTPIPGRGWSSPAVAGKQVWLTAATDGDTSLRAICVDRESGKIVHDVEVFKLDTAPKVHNKNTPASPTAVVAGDKVFVHFGTLGTACLTTAGEIVWKTQELKFQHVHGPAGSPVLYRDLVLVNCDGGDKRFMAALDQKTGQLRWKADREGSMAYSTPLVIQVDGADQIVSPCGEWVYSYDADGAEIWKVRYPGGYSNVPRPVYGGGLVYVSSGYNTPILYAIRPNGKGDVTETHVAWKMEKGAPLNPSPLFLDGRLYVASDRGILSCLEAATGKEVWKERIPGNYSASFVHAAGRIYIQNETGVTTVFAPGDTFQKLAENELEGRTLATLAPAGGAIYLRTDLALYKIGK